MPSLAFQNGRYWRTSVLGFSATGMPTLALPMLATPSPWYGRTIATPGNSQAWLCPALFLKQQVASSSHWLAPPMPHHHTFSPDSGLFISNPGSRVCLHLRDPLPLDETAPGFSSCFLLSCGPFSPPAHQGWGGVGRKCQQFSFAFPRTGLYTPICGARPCLSSQVLAHTFPPVSSPT